MTTSSIFTPDLGEQVLKTLSRYAKLPATGVVAGQSVASAIDEVLGGAKPVYNDIDIFLDERRWEAKWPGSKEQVEKLRSNQRGLFMGSSNGMLTERVRYEHDVSVVGNEYEQCTWLHHRQLYSIQQSRNEGLLNYVCVEWDGMADHTLRTADEEVRARLETAWLPKVFDLNCTQAAVDLSTGILHVTPHFERFHQSRQLQVVTGFTPVHSLLRYLKKRKELDAYGDDAAHIELARRLVQQGQGDAALVQVRQRAFREGRIGITLTEIDEQRERNRQDYGSAVPGWSRAGQGGLVPLSFGRKYLDLYVKHQKVLNDHFRLSRHSRRDLWLFTSKHDSKGEQTFDYDLSPTVVALRFAEERLAPSKMAKARAAGLELLIEALEEPIQQRAMRLASLNLGPEYLEGMEDPNLRERWLEVTPKHREFLWPTVGLTFRDQLTLMRKLRTEFKKIGMRDPWGTLSMLSHSHVSELLTNEYVWADFIKEHSGTLEPLCTPLRLPTSLNGVAIKELTTTRELIREGNVQRHCVGGYSYAVREARSRILSFSTGESSSQRSTAEWRISVSYGDPGKGEPEVKGISFEFGQHYGAGNTKAPEDLAAVETQLRAQMNGWAADNLELALNVLNLKVRPKSQLSSSVVQQIDEGNEFPF